MGFITWAVDTATNEARYVLSTSGPAPYVDTRIALEPVKLASSPLAIVTYDPSLPDDSRHSYQQRLCDALISELVPEKPVLTLFRAFNVLKSQPGIEAIAMRSGNDGGQLYLLWPDSPPPDFLLRVSSDRTLGSLSSDSLSEDTLVETSFSDVETVRLKESTGEGTGTGCAWLLLVVGVGFFLLW